MTGQHPPTGAHPRVLVAAACQAMGEQAVVDWCVDLIADRTRPEAPDLRWLGGSEDWPPYWQRVWGLRALLYVWSEQAAPVVIGALADEQWRVREGAARVCAHRLLEDAMPQLDALRTDANPRVATAAERGVRRIGTRGGGSTA